MAGKLLKTLLWCVTLLGCALMTQAKMYSVRGAIESKCVTASHHRVFCLEKEAQHLEYQQTIVSVNGGAYSSLVDNSGNFNVKVPSPGVYKVEVQNL